MNESFSFYVCIYLCMYIRYHSYTSARQDVLNSDELIVEPPMVIEYTHTF